MWQEQGSYQVTPPCRESTAPRPEAGRQIETKAQTGQVGVESDPPRPRGTYKYEWSVFSCLCLVAAESMLLFLMLL